MDTPQPGVKRADRQYNRYMNDVQSYLGKVQRGRSVRRVDPQSEAFGEAQERQRQVQRLDSANVYDRLLRGQSSMQGRPE
jgi:hypothetical protein